MSNLWLDVRYALRMMWRSPGLTTILVVTLALGIGASTTIFSVVNSVLLKPLPYKAPDKLVRMYTEFLGPHGLPKFWISAPEFDDVRRQCRSCESIAAWASGSAVIAGGDRPVRVDAAYTTASLATVLGVKPMMGRWFDESEDGPLPDPTVIVLGYDVWQRAFAGDPSIIGMKITSDALPVTVIGVMPPGFDFLGRQEAWLPLRMKVDQDRRGSHGLSSIIRLKPDASVSVLQAELDALVAEQGKLAGPQKHMFQPKEHTLLVAGFQSDLTGGIAKSLWLLQGAVLLVLLISIVNIANLLLARSETRNREVAIRHALGANRRRLMRQFVTESVLLGLVGGALGVLVSVWAVDAIASLIPRSAPRVNEIELDMTAVLFAGACAVGAALLFGIAPILHARKTDVHSSLKDGSNRMTGSRARLRVRRALVIAEIVLAVVLVVGCVVMVRSFLKLQRVDVGYNPENLLTFGIELPEKTYPGMTPDVFWTRAHEGVQQVGGVKGVALVDGLWPERQLIANSFSIPGRMVKDGERPLNTDHWQIITPGGLELLGAKLLKGRTILPSDTYEAPAVMVVNESFAKAFFPNEDPIGKRVRINGYGPDKDNPAPEQEIVGVVADIKTKGIDVAPGTEVFIPLYQYPKLSWRTPDKPRSNGIMFFAVRTIGDPRAVLPGVQAKLAEIDPTLPMFQVRTMDDVMWEAIARPRFLAVILSAFAALALLLAAVGIYGVMAHTVAQRTHEIGLRVALGAQPKQVALMVLKQAGMLVVVGVAIGIGVSIALEVALGKPLHVLFYGQSLAEPVLLVTVAVGVTLAAILATWIPVRRATRVQPTVALRSE
ncbi:MAG: ABC transporter permease [Myxococcota bacterium]|nr:ABC transporter permease [Myxococcota bacterium]